MTGAYTITPLKKQISKPIAYVVSIASLLVLGLEIPIIAYRKYWLIGIPILIFFLIDWISKQYRAWYKKEEFKIQKPNGMKPYLQFNYYDILSSDSNWVKVYKINKVNRYRINNTKCVIYCDIATVQNPPMKPRSVKKVVIHDVDDNVIEMIQEIIITNKR